MKEEKVLKLKEGGVTWRIDKERLDLFAEFLNRERAGPGKEALKESSICSITSLPIEGEETVLFVKRQRYPTNLTLLKYLFVAKKGVTEWRMDRKLLARGIPTGLSVAVGKKLRLGVLKETILVTVSLGEVRDLFQYCQDVLSLPQGPVRIKAKRELGLALADLLSRAHKAGIFHHDLRGGNILVRKEGEGSLNLFLTDLQGVKVGRASFSKAVANLSQLGPFFEEISSRADRLRFLRAYLNTGRRDKISSLARAVEKRSRKMDLNFYLCRGKRCLKENRDFTSFVAGRLRAWVRRSHFCPEFKAFLCDLWGPSTVLKGSSDVTSGLTPYSGPGPARELYVKMQQIRGIKALRYLFSHSRPERAWVGANGLLLRGVATPLPLAYLRRREGIFNYRYLFVSESPADTVRIEDYIKQVSWTREIRKRFLSSLATTLKTMHKRGVYHGDLKANNMLVREDQGQGLEVLLVDLDRAKFGKRISLRHRVKDLARINAALHHLFTVRERLFFFQLYEKGDKELRQRRKKLLKSIERLSQKKIIKKAQACAENELAFG